DPRILDGGGAASLVEALAGLRPRELATQPHQRDLSLHRRVVGFVDLPEPAIAPKCDHPVAMRHHRIGFEQVTGAVAHRVLGNHTKNLHATLAKDPPFGSK